MRFAKRSACEVEGPRIRPYRPNRQDCHPERSRGTLCLYFFLWGLAHLYVLCKGGDSCRRLRDFDLGLAALLDSHRALFPESIPPIAAPRPLPVTTASDEMQVVAAVVALGMVGHRASVLARAKKSCDRRPLPSPPLQKS